MPTPNLLQSVGAQTQKPTKNVPLFTSRYFNGLVTNRNLLRSPLSVFYSEFYKLGATDCLCGGVNSELSTQLTMIRRPGNLKFSTAKVPGIVDSFYSAHFADGTIDVITDSSTTVGILTPSSWTSLITKASGAGEGYFCAVDESLYICDGVDLLKFIPGTTNPTNGSSIWNWGGAPATVAPTLTVVQEASAGVAWAASTFYSTMGLLVDGKGNIQFLTSVTQNGNTGNTGSTGSGAPIFSLVFGGTVVDNTCNWTCKGQLQIWTPDTTYSALAPIFDPASGGVYVAVGSGPFVSGSSRPRFNPTFNTHTSDSSNTFGWEFIGMPQLWAPSTTYNSFWEHPNQMVVTPVLPDITLLSNGDQAIFVETNNDQTVGSNNSPGTSASSGYTPNWATTAGLPTADGDLLWVCLGSKTWAADTQYSGWSQGSTDFSAIVDATGNFQVALTTGISGSTVPYSRWAPSHSFALNTIIAVQKAAGSYYQFKATTVTGASGTSEPTNWNFTTSSTTTDHDITWTCEGLTTAGVAVFGQNYGSQSTLDGAVSWVNVGSAANSTWAASTVWYLPPNGFAPPSPSQPYGGASVIGSAFNQFVTQSGLSGTPSAPSWSVTIGDTTADNTAIWTCVSAFSAASFTWTKGYGYCFAYKARTTGDVYITTAPPLSLPGTNSPNIIGPLGSPTGCEDGTVTTASPVAQITGAQTGGAQVIISGPGSLDPQFDTVVIYRSTDGFQSGGPYLELTEINMPPSANGQPGVWSVIDFMPDLATSLLPGLDPLVEAPVADANDPPPGQYGSLFFTAASVNTPAVPAAGTGLQGVTYHQGRLWGFIGNNLFASGGPDTNPGNGFTAWPADQVFPFASNITKLLSTSAGLLVFTTTDLAAVFGGPAITSYYSQLVVPGLGTLSANSVTSIGGTPVVYTSDGQILQIEPSSGVTRIGHNIANLLVGSQHSGGLTINFNPATSYLVHHSSGDLDHALYLGDGSSSWFRADTALAPDSSVTGPVWSPIAQINGGNCKAIASLETSPGTHQLLIGSGSADDYVYVRDSSYSIFSDGGAPSTGAGGTSYPSWYVIGSIVLANPGQIAKMEFLEFDFANVGSQPVVSVLFDEIYIEGSGSNATENDFEIVSNTVVQDPPKLHYGDNAPISLFMNRYNFGQTTTSNPGLVPVPCWGKHLCIKVDFGDTDSVKNENFAFTIFGSLWQES